MLKLTKRAIRYVRTDPNYRKALLLKRLGSKSIVIDQGTINQGRQKRVPNTLVGPDIRPILILKLSGYRILKLSGYRISD